MQVFILAGFALPILFFLDLLWVGVLSQGFYRAQLEPLLSPDTIWPVAAIFYVVYALALSYFAIKPAVAAHSLKKAVLVGGFLGLATYIVYDFTNWATLADWPWLVSLVDLAWGVAVSALAAGGSYLIATKVAKF